MSNLYILACKELNGSVYLTRLPKAISDNTPGVPDNWYLVGPGTNPSVMEYTGTKFILTFNYLSHLYCRIVDIATWPPTEVQPVQISGGPNPPNPIEYNIGNPSTGSGVPADSFYMQTIGAEALSPPGGAVGTFYNPPVIQFPLLFLDPVTSTYSVTLSPIVGYAPQSEANQTTYFRLYTRVFPYTGPWVLAQDWTVTAASFPWFSFVFSSVGSLRYEFSVVWGSGIDSNVPFNPTQHNQGVPGLTYITVDSTVVRASFQATCSDMLTLKESSALAFGIFAPRQIFYVEEATDEFSLSRSLLGSGSGDAFGYFGTRQSFFNETASDTIPVFSASEAPKGGNAFGFFAARS